MPLFVTCVLPTADRPEFTAQAIGYFRSQTYPAANLRLLVYDTSREVPAAVSAIEPEIPDGPTHVFIDDRICYWYEPRRPGDTIGAIRNRANSTALSLWPSTEILAHMDSDDYYGAGYISSQVEALSSSGKPIVGFGTAKFTDGDRWWWYRGTFGFALGASLVYLPDYWRSHPFPDRNVGEDGDWSRAAANSGKIYNINSGGDRVAGYTPNDLLVARCHAGNTSPKVPGEDWERLN